jgi:carbonic anhydrase/acetyltransferase-like protein (isoleucine patch superfamily)
MDSREYAFEGSTPDVHEDACVSQESTLVGDVTVAADATVWPGAILRADMGPVTVGEGSAIGDNAVLHSSTIGEDGMIGHGAVLNESHVGDGALVGFNASVSKTTIGEGSIVAMGTVIPPGYDVPPESFARGTPAQVTPLSATDVDRTAVVEDFASGDLLACHENLFDK